ncbi:MAG TPA: hypothetical protein VLV78_12535 [Thermoanaerobaculia bacterium]|nr:hypothetical protein [Thermoanaerobaculia bacterium]
MEQHFKIVAVLQIVYGAFFLVVGLFLFLVVAGAGALSGDRGAMLITGTVGLIVGGAFILFSIPSIVGGIGVLKRREWGRILTIILSFFHLLNFPIGTIVGAYSLWALFSEPARAYFD